MNQVTTVNKIDEGDIESLWVMLKQKNHKRAIGVFIGPQEREPIEERQRQLNILQTQILQIKQEAKVILTGDFNARLKIEKENAQQDRSSSGKLLKELIESTHMTPISTKAIEGNLTRVNRKNPNEKSIIDYIFINSGRN